MLKKILLALILVATTVARAESDLKTAASKAYVDTSVETLQDKIPAAGGQNVPEGETVMTYTAAGNGAIGERGIYTGANAYNANTDAEKLITASALNDTFTNLPTTDTTKLQCANLNDGCTLWTIVDQTAYSGLNLNTVLNATATSECYKRLYNGNVESGLCTIMPINYGDWGVTFSLNDETIQVNGVSACRILSATTRGDIPSDQSAVQSDYEGDMASAPTPIPAGVNCYCKLTTHTNLPWVFLNGYGTQAYCSNGCAAACANQIRTSIYFRGAVFGTAIQ